MLQKLRRNEERKKKRTNQKRHNLPRPDGAEAGGDGILVRFAAVSVLELSDLDVLPVEGVVDLLGDGAEGADGDEEGDESHIWQSDR